MGVLEAFDMGSLDDKLLFLHFYWVCGVGS